MNLIGRIRLALALASFLPASALTPPAPGNCIWEISNIGYDAPATEVTELGSSTETSTSNYDTAPIHRAITEEIPIEANRSLLGQNAEFKAAEGGINYGALDSLGRPTGVSATITEDMIGTGTAANPSITPPGWTAMVLCLMRRVGTYLARSLGALVILPKT